MENLKHISTEICLIAPTDKLADNARRLIRDMNLEIDVYVASMEDAIALSQVLIKKGAKILISRKGTKTAIASSVTIPVVGIESSITDYVKPMKQVQSVNGKFAFFSFDKLSDEMWALCEMLNIDANVYYFKTIKDSESCVLRAIADGCVIAIGGATTALASQKHGLPHIIFENPDTSITHAIESALQILQVQKDEARKNIELQTKLERYEMVFNYTHDAIIAVNDQGLVDVMNSVAAKILNDKTHSLIGMHIDKLIPDTRMMEVIRTGEPQLNELLKISDILVSTNRLPIKVGNDIMGAVATFQDVKKLQDDEKEIRFKMYKKGNIAKYHFEHIIGNSDAICSVKKIAHSYAASDSTILIYGETGTGKELFAQSIHNASQRKHAQFVAVNCASIPQNLLEAELFGYEEGSFTGALKKGKPGLFEIAHGGTIFLDEISEIPAGTQLQLLRVLQEKEIRRIGSDKVTPVDIRVISATNKDLMHEISASGFRQDLFYRLNILNIEVPPLRARKDDVIPIALNVFRKLSGTSDEKMIQEFLTVMHCVQEYQWPGNVRELNNFIERIYVLLNHNYSTDAIQDVVNQLLYSRSARPTAPAPSPIPVEESDMDVWEKNLILETLKKNNRVITKTAEDLNISRSTLWRKIKKYNIKV